MLKHPATTRARSRGFSITELIVVIGIAALLIGFTFPVISSLFRGTKISGGLNTIGMSVDVARQWVALAAWDTDLTGLPPQPQDYSGTAALVCPTGEVRIVVNERRAQDQNNNFLEANTVNKQNGYSDLNGVDYIQIPNGVGVVGIFRDSSGVRLLAPPFAIAFNENGHMHFGDGNGQIYYDGDGSGRYETNDDRSGYDPAEWDGTSGSNNDEVLNRNSGNAGDLRRALPFDAIACVPGVIVYEADAFPFNFDNNGEVQLGTPAGDWLDENGVSLFFSPHTGAALTNEAQ